MGNQEARAAWLNWEQAQRETRHAALSALFQLTLSGLVLPPRVAFAIEGVNEALSKELEAGKVWSEFRAAADVAEQEAMVAL